MDKVFLDSDVLLDYLLDRPPFSKGIGEILSLGDQGRIALFTSGLVFSNCYYILRKWSGHQKIIRTFKTLISFIDILEMDRDVVRKALDSSFPDFEDALQHASARAAGMTVLVTRNIKDFRKSELAVMTPDEYLAMRASL